MRWSRQRGSHPQPSAYYAGALLLSYGGWSAKRDLNPPWWLTALDPVLANLTGHRANQLHYSPAGSPGKSFALVCFERIELPPSASGAEILGQLDYGAWRIRGDLNPQQGDFPTRFKGFRLKGLPLSLVEPRILVRLAGIEPASADWRSAVLPLNERRW